VIKKYHIATEHNRSKHTWKTAIGPHLGSGLPSWGFGVFKHHPPQNSEDIGGVLDRMSKKNRRLNFLL